MMLSSPSTASSPTVHCRLFLLPSPWLSPSRPPKWGLRTKPDGVAIPNKTKGQAFRLLAGPNVSYAREDPINDVMMVDPLEAKRLAANQLKQLKAKEKFQRRREIEAINGAWAMIGLTAGLVIESQTGKGILGQLGGFLEAVFSFFIR
ncbi:hypothetical protein MLD38_014054 [Melastoma candidum]|uniref:Uncharacterized protein n=1 Tax=Melastoma candidum TaxID=119954 RepID=A0ACB9RB58_9MYRT|nr:hypothetical protein MLD38_014054 [Melastoma candidum]